MIIVILDRPETCPTRAPTFEARINRTVLCRSSTPIYDAARALLARGVDPTHLMTARHRDRATNIVRPAPIGELAKWSVIEPQAGGLRRIRFKKFDRPQTGL